VENDAHTGDCLTLLEGINPRSVDLVYLDPPFFTKKIHSSSTRDGATSYAFSDVWAHSDDFLSFLSARLMACKKTIKESGSIFVHADHNSVHLVRQALDLVFGIDHFRSEIIWHYKRWSNPKRGLLQQHQTILHYSISENFKWNPVFVDYSATTNIDQILQKRARDNRGKSVYATNEEGKTVFGSEKRGVPLGDVWEIPFLNPKAKERTGYPTQKPLLLLERIIQLTTDDNDLVVDPFCGSGTTLVAAKLMKRRYLGIDILPEAVVLSKQRLSDPVKTESAVMRDGADSYLNCNPWVEAHLIGLSHVRIQRNLGADAILKDSVDGKTAFIRVQRKGESISQAVFSLKKTIATKGDAIGFVIATEADLFTINDAIIKIIQSPALQLNA
jgi:site-specific DNA-methyltransferase (adenine-specific)